MVGQVFARLFATEAQKYKMCDMSKGLANTLWPARKYTKNIYIGLMCPVIVCYKAG